MKHKMGKKITKGEHKYPIKIWKDFKLSNNHGNVNYNHNELLFHTITNSWQILKYQSIPSVGKDGEWARA